VRIPPGTLGRTDRSMRVSILVASILFLLCGFTTAEASSKSRTAAIASATKAALAWLKLVDEGSYAASWTAASSLFKGHLSEAKWTQMASSARRPLGSVISRKLNSAKFETSMPAAPHGQFVVIRFETSFQHKKSAIETVTPMLDSDGHWHVSDYYISSVAVASAESPR
jgi:Protein of unknown function (DUF4019)